jgi:hypothetical protein
MLVPEYILQQTQIFEKSNVFLCLTNFFMPYKKDPMYVTYNVSIHIEGTKTLIFIYFLQNCSSLK